MRVVFLLVFLMAWPGGVTSNPLPDVDAEEFGRSGLSTSQGIDGVVGQTLDRYLDEHQGSTGDDTRGDGDGVVAGRNRKLSSSDGESGDVPMPKAVVDTKSFEVSSGNDAQVNILAGSKVVIKINPSPFESISDYKSPNKLKMDLICDGNGGGDSAEFGFYRSDDDFTTRINVGDSKFKLVVLEPNDMADFVFENSKVTSSKINADLGQSPIPFTAPNCLKNSDGQGVWRAKFSTADSRVKFKVEIENTVVSAGSVTAIGEKSGDKTAAAGVRWWGWAMIAVAITGAIVGGLVALYFCYFKKKDAKGEQDKTEVGSGGDDGNDEEDSKDSQKSGKNQKSKKKKKGGKKGKKKGNKANANAAAAGAGDPNQANPNGQAAAAAAGTGANAAQATGGAAAATPAAPAAGAATPGANAATANGQAANNAPAKFGNKVGVAAAAENNYQTLAALNA